MQDRSAPPIEDTPAGAIRRVVTNAISLLASDVANRAATFAIYALVARYLGTLSFGRLALALTFFQTFQLFAVAGLQSLLAREISKSKETTGQYFANGSVVVTGFSLVSMVALVACVLLLGYAWETSSVILLMGLSLLPYALSVVCDAVFQAWERMHFIAYANAIVNVTKVGLAYVLLASGHSLYALVLVIFGCHMASLLFKVWLLVRYVGIPHFRVQPHLCRRIARATTTFLGINAATAVQSILTVMLLSKLRGEVAVGLYSAASQLLVPIGLVFQSIVSSVFPVMCRSVAASTAKLQLVAERSLEMLLALVLPTTVGLFFLADQALVMLYGDQQFAVASVAVRIMVWSLVLRVFTHVLGGALIASSRERLNLRITVVDVVANAVLGAILIPQFGLVGAALTSLLVRLVDFVQHCIPIFRIFPELSWLGTSWRSIVASGVMACYLAHWADENIWRTIGGAALLYVVLWMALTVWSAGGAHQLKSKYLSSGAHCRIP